MVSGDLFLYESALVGAFNYLWGHRDAELRKPCRPPILANAQNPLDRLLGDAIAQVAGRYFIVEFKQAKQGFSDEVRGARAKASRKRLYAHLWESRDCQQLARFGHFAAYLQDDELAIQRYACAIGPGGRRRPPEPLAHYEHELMCPSGAIGFPMFYEQANVSACRPAKAGLFPQGLGLPPNGLVEYLDCVLRQFSVRLSRSPGRTAGQSADERRRIVSQRSLALLVSVYATGAVGLVPTNFLGLLEAFAALQRLAPPSSALTGPAPEAAGR